MAQVLFLTGEALPDSTADTTFYLLNNGDLYIGNQKLNNIAEINALKNYVDNLFEEQIQSLENLIDESGVLE